MGRPYHVHPDGNKWKVRREGAREAYSSHNSKNRAVEAGKRVADRNNVGVIVHRADGTVQYGWECGTTGAR